MFLTLQIVHFSSVVVKSAQMQSKKCILNVDANISITDKKNLTQHFIYFFALWGWEPCWPKLQAQK